MGEHVIELDVLNEADGVALYVERARAAGSAVRADDPVIVRLCDGSMACHWRSS